MTKRDVADIVLVWIGLKVFIQFLGNFCLIIGRLFIPDVPNITWKSPISDYSLQAIVFLSMAIILLLNRRVILNLLFPRASLTKLTICDSCAALADLSFWIRLLGTFTLIQAVMKFVFSLTMYFPIKQSPLSENFVWTSVMPQLVTIPLALLVVWQSDRIATMMNRLGKDKNQIQNIDTDAANSDL